MRHCYICGCSFSPDDSLLSCPRCMLRRERTDHEKTRAELERLKACLAELSVGITDLNSIVLEEEGLIAPRERSR